MLSSGPAAFAAAYYRPATAADITPAMRESAREIAQVTIAVRTGKATPDDLRAAMRASREQHGDDLHEVVKGLALASYDGGRA